MQRRKFLKNAVTTSAAFTIVPSFVLGKNHVPPSDTLYVAAFGVGGRGYGVIQGMAATKKVKFVAFCDVDDRRAARTYNEFPNIKRYKDFRKIYDTHLSEIDCGYGSYPRSYACSDSLAFYACKEACLC